jgi:hypothetical protein
LNRSRYILAAALLAAAAVALAATGGWRWLADAAIATAALVHERYGIDIPLALALFGLGEIVFCCSIGAMLAETGKQVSWHNIHEFKLRSLHLGSKRMLRWLWVNRLSWVVPWLVVIVMSLGRVPWWATGAAMVEVGMTLGLGILVSLGLRLPWWNERGVSLEEA